MVTQIYKEPENASAVGPTGLPRGLAKELARTVGGTSPRLAGGVGAATTRPSTVSQSGVGSPRPTTASGGWSSAKSSATSEPTTVNSQSALPRRRSPSGTEGSTSAPSAASSLTQRTSPCSNASPVPIPSLENAHEGEMPERPMRSERSPSVDLKQQGRIKVIVRIRPLSSKESSQGDVDVLQTSPDAPKSLWLPVSAYAPINNLTELCFDSVLGKDATQEGVFEVVGEPAVQNVINGFHGCIFAYGATGAGKSHSTFGGIDRDRGLLPRIAESLFAELADQDGMSIVKMSYLEIYND